LERGRARREGVWVVEEIGGGVGGFEEK